MGRTPNRMYRKITQQAFTRKEYAGGIPGLRISQFELGDKNGEFPAVFHLVAVERCQIRHSALEAARIASNRVLAKKCGSLGYHIKIRPYPHHILRQNKQASGAGADRISDGMRRSYGKPIGTAARVEVGQEIITVRTSWGHLHHAKDALRRASMKLPTPCRIVIVGEIPKNIEELERTATVLGSTEVAEPKPVTPEAEAAEGEPGAEGEAAEGEAKEGAEGKEGKPGEKGKPGDKGKPGEKGKPGDKGAEKGPAKGGDKKPEGKGGDKGKK